MDRFIYFNKTGYGRLATTQEESKRNKLGRLRILFAYRLACIKLE